MLVTSLFYRLVATRPWTVSCTARLTTSNSSRRLAVWPRNSKQVRAPFFYLFIFIISGTFGIRFLSFSSFVLIMCCFNIMVYQLQGHKMRWYVHNLRDLWSILINLLDFLLLKCVSSWFICQLFSLFYRILLPSNDLCTVFFLHFSLLTE